jgi:murein DD-endopeptidase MepM/ murein hydrolase activator NlpD
VYDSDMLRRTCPLAGAAIGLLLALASPASAAAPQATDERWRPPANWPFAPPDGLRRGVHGLPAFWSDGSTCATGCRPRGARSGWPLRPFHRRHPLRAGLNELRSSSFHHGIDIQCDDGQEVYAIQSGHAHIVERSGSEERVQVGSYVYWHVNIGVREGQSVRAYRTVLGTTKNGFGHLHLSELGPGSRYLNPLRPGGRVHRPWSDAAPPVLARPRFLRDGRVLVEAFDPQSYTVRTTYRTPVLAPAALAYRVLDAGGHGVTRLHWALRGSQNLDWSAHRLVYASDTRAPTFWCWIRNPNCRPRWDYVLAGGLGPSLPKLGLRSGRYKLAVYAWDWAGNVSSIRAGFRARGGSAPRARRAPEGRPRTARAHATDDG